jgi:hypothetical protein
MKILFIRIGLILAVFSIGSFAATLLGVSSVALVVWFSLVASWVLILGFQKSLPSVIILLLIGDILWDSAVGPVFLAGLALAVLVTYTAVRLESRTRELQFLVYGLYIWVFSLLPVFWSGSFSWADLSLPNLSLLLYHAFGVSIFFLVYPAVQKIEIGYQNRTQALFRGVRS